MFEPVAITTNTLNVISLWSAVLQNAPDEDDNEDCGRLDSVVARGSICAIALDGRFALGQTFWFILVEDDGVSDSDDFTDSSGHSIPKGTPYISCFYLEKHTDNKKGTVYKRGKT